MGRKGWGEYSGLGRISWSTVVKWWGLALAGGGGGGGGGGTVLVILAGKPDS